MSKESSSAGPRPAPAAGRRNFRLSSLEILITVLIFLGVLYLLTMWATNMFTPGEEATAPTAPPGAMVERALAASEKVLAEQISQSRDFNALRKQVEALQAQARKNPGASAGDPADAAQDRRLDEVDRILGEINHKLGQVPDIKPLLARLDKLEKDLAPRPAVAAGSSASAADPQLLARLDKIEKDLAAKTPLPAPQAPAPQADPKLLARLDKIEKDLAAKTAPPAAPGSDPQMLARLDKVEKDLAAKPTAPNPAAAALVQLESRLQRLETGLQEAREGLSHPRPAADPHLAARLERLEKAFTAAPGAAPVPAASRETRPTRSEARQAGRNTGRTESEARKVSHKVKTGETLGGLARRYKVTENDIVRWNSMGTRRLLLKGESLVIYPGQNT